MRSKLFRTPNSVDPFGNKGLPSFFMTVDFIDFVTLLRFIGFTPNIAKPRAVAFGISLEVLRGKTTFSGH